MRTSIITTAAAAIVCSFVTNAQAAEYPQAINLQYSNGWDYATWAAGEIYTTTRDSTWKEYRTDRLSQSNVNAVFARIGKWGGSDGTNAFAYEEDWYFEELAKDTLYQSCPDSVTYIFGKTDERLCNSVDYSQETWLDTCYDNAGAAHSCRIYQFSEYNAYNDTCIITHYDEGAGFHSSRFGLIKYRYNGSLTNYYRTFVVYNSIS